MALATRLAGSLVCPDLGLPRQKPTGQKLQLLHWKSTFTIPHEKVTFETLLVVLTLKISANIAHTIFPKKGSTAEESHF
jgi:hypothetical protein